MFDTDDNNFADEIDALCFGISVTGLVKRKVNGLLSPKHVFWSGRESCLDADCVDPTADISQLITDQVLVFCILNENVTNRGKMIKYLFVKTIDTLMSSHFII